MKKGDRYSLPCGHDGKVIWVNPDETSFCVQGTKRSCQLCGKKSVGTWTPTVYTIEQEITPEP
jgi:hypothetical protein